MPSILEYDGRLIESRVAKCYDCGEDFETYDESIPDGGIGRCDDCAEEERYDEMEKTNVSTF